MLSPVKVIDLELSQPLPVLQGLTAYVAVWALVRWQGVPIGTVKAPVVAGCCDPDTLSQLLDQHQAAIVRQQRMQLLSASLQETLPLVTVAVCTRDRTADLAGCLEALVQLDYPALDLLVIDNAPTSDATRQVVQRYASVRYVCEPRPGLDWARNRAILEARGEIIAYTDDDVRVAPDWVRSIATGFADPDVMAITGLVVPDELETDAQVLFEQYGGFGRGFERLWLRVPIGQRLPWKWLGTGRFGTGANMAYRRSVFTKIGGFDPALDVGTLTNGAGDIEMFFRLLKAGHTLLYEPRAIVWHRHRRDVAALHKQITHYGSVYSYLVRTAIAYPDERRSVLLFGALWMVWNLRRWLLWHRSTPQLRRLVRAELWGGLVGLTRYLPARRRAAVIAAQFPDLPTLTAVAQPLSAPPQQPFPQAVAVCTVELTQPLSPLRDLSDYRSVQVYLTQNSVPIASLAIVNHSQPVSVMQLAEAIVQQPVQPPAALPPLPATVPVAIIVGTCDRPDDLRNCLRGLVAQVTPRSVEIIVVDNRPASGLTPPVVSEFPGVTLLSELRQGSSYARNTGITHSRSEIIVTTDDDVVHPPEWLERLIAPFARPEVMVVTGNVLPLELTTPAQQLFERYANGGLGRGFDRFEVDRVWFDRSRLWAAPVWELGATANAAFRASIFYHPQIGLMREELGAGVPAGGGEDLYLFYKVLKAGYTLVYEATAHVWHKHRRDRSALRRQIYNYSKAAVALQLTTLWRDRDWRGLIYLLVALPLYYKRLLGHWLLGKRDYPLSLILLEIAGNLAGPWSLWRSVQHARRQGRSAPYRPVAERPVAASTQAAESLSMSSP
jgi:GT2 family glycosyltransferase